MRCQIHLAKGALSDQPAEGVVADRREVIGRELAAKEARWLAQGKVTMGSQRETGWNEL